MFADNRLRGRLIREELGGDVSGAVEPLEELELVAKLVGSSRSSTRPQRGLVSSSLSW